MKVKNSKSSREFLSIIIPAYKAEKFIVKSITKVIDVMEEVGYPYEIICVVDGKVDNTYKIVEKLAKKFPQKVFVLGYKINRGKGHAVRHGMSKARGNIIGFIDAGFDIKPSGIRMLLEHFKWYKADIIIGSKRHSVSKVKYPWQRKILSYGYQITVRILFGLKVKDTQVGLKFFRREVLEKVLPRLLVKTFAFDIEMLSVANYLGFKRIYEAPVELRMEFGKSTIISKGFVRTVTLMLWDTLAVFYRLRILNYYHFKNRKRWINSSYSRTRKIKRILVLSWRDPKHSLAGGAEQVMHQHMKGWIEKGYDVTLFSSRFPKSKPLDAIEGVKVIRKGYQYLGVQIAAFLYYLRYGSDYDLVVDQFHGLPFFTPLYVRKPKLAVIQEVAREVWLLNNLPYPMNKVIGYIGYLCEPQIFLFYKKTKFLTGSNSTKQDLVALGIAPKDIFIIPHGVIIETSNRKFKKEHLKTVIYLGVMSKDKGIEDALKVFSLLRKQKRIQFWVVGKPDSIEYGKKIAQMSQDLQLTDKIKFWGFVSNEKKFELLSRAHVMINPSHREGWGLVNIEAGVVGTPVVGFNTAGVKESIIDGKTGLLSSAGNHSAMSKNILKLLENKKLYRKFSKNALAWSNNFTWVKAQKKSIKLLKTYE